MKNDCHYARETIQHFLDGEKPLPEWAKEHIRKCKPCRSFKESLEEFPIELKSSIDKEIETLEPPDFSILPDRLSGKIGHKVFIPWIAALFVFAVILTFSYHGYMSYKTSSFLKEENRFFVENLFNKSIFEEGETIEGLALFTEWFQSTEIVPDLIGDFSQINNSD